MVLRHPIKPVGQTVLFPFQVVLALKTHPELGGIAEETRKQEGGLRRDGTLTVDDRVNTASIHANCLGQPILGDLQWAEKFLIENLTRVYGSQIPVAVRRRFIHLFESFSLSDIPGSVVIHDLDLIGVPLAPDKAYSPLFVDADTVLALTIT